METFAADNSRRSRPILVKPQVTTLTAPSGQRKLAIVHIVQGTWEELSAVAHSNKRLTVELSQWFVPLPHAIKAPSLAKCMGVSTVGGDDIMSTFLRLKRHSVEWKDLRDQTLKVLLRKIDMVLGGNLDLPRVCAVEEQREQEVAALLHSLVKWKEVRTHLRKHEKARMSALAATATPRQGSFAMQLLEEMERTSAQQTGEHRHHDRCIQQLHHVLTNTSRIADVATWLRKLHPCQLVEAAFRNEFRHRCVAMVWVPTRQAAMVTPFVGILRHGCSLQRQATIFAELLRLQQQTVWLDTSASGHGGKTVVSLQRLHHDKNSHCAVVVRGSPTSPDTHDLTADARIGLAVAGQLIMWLCRLRCVLNCVLLLASNDASQVKLATEWVSNVPVQAAWAVPPEWKETATTLQSSSYLTTMQGTTKVLHVSPTRGRCVPN